MREKIPALGIIFLMVILAIFFLPPVSSEEPATSPEVVLKLDQKTLVAKVAPGQLGIVTATGTVKMNNTIEVLGNVTVRLSASAENLPVTITPSGITLDRNNHTRSFSVSVKVMPQTEMTKTYTLEVCGEAWMEAGGPVGDIEPTDAQITVKQYFRFGVTCQENPIKECKVGQVLYFNFEVANCGNGRDIIGAYLTPDTIEAINDTGFKVSLNTSNITIPCREHRSIELKVISPSSIDGIYLNKLIELKIRFYSMMAVKEDSIILDYTYIQYVRLLGAYPGGLNAQPWTVALCIGAFLVIIVIIGVMIVVNFRSKGTIDARGGKIGLKRSKTSKNKGKNRR